MKKTLFYLFVAILFVFLIGCSSKVQEKPDPIVKQPVDNNLVDDNQNVPIVDSKEYLMGILPLSNPTIMLERFGQVEAYLKEETGLNIRLRFYPTEGELGGYSQVVREITDGDIHFAYLAPVTTVQANGINSNVVPFICAQNKGSPTYTGDLVVLADSSFQSLADLEGKKVTGTSVSSTSGGLFPSALLLEEGIDRDSYFDGGLQFLGSHDKAVEAVLAGTMDAAFINEDTLNKWNDEGKLRSIWTHEPVAEFPFVVNQEIVSLDVIEKVKIALLKMHETNLDGVKAISKGYDKFVEISFSDYASAKAACDTLYGDSLYDLDTWGE
jgi:phosphonate transport system substrate-binding protein